MALRVHHSESLERLGRALQDARSVGVVRVHLADHDEAITVGLVDAFVATCGYAPCGEHWSHPTLDEATRLLTATLTLDLAYGECVMNDEDCEEGIAAFVSLVANDAGGVRCFANSRWDERKGARGWFRVMTGATFDAVVVMASSRRIGAIVIEDED